MKKRFFAKALAAAALALAAAVAGCSSDDGDAWDSALNGTWVSAAGMGSMTFTTGSLSWQIPGQPTAFVSPASTGGGFITFTLPGDLGGGQERSAYRISGSTLTLTLGGDETVWQRQ
jgi:hypothetical protein